jgi:hypothetical protein
VNSMSALLIYKNPQSLLNIPHHLLPLDLYVIALYILRVVALCSSTRLPHVLARRVDVTLHDSEFLH